MIDFIKSEFRRIIFNALKRFSAQQDVDLNSANVQMMMSVENDEVIYRMCQGYTPVVKWSFLQVLGVRIDFKAYSFIVPPFIKKTIARFAEEINAPVEEIEIMLLPQADTDEQIMIYFYNRRQPIKEIELDGLFNPEDIELPQEI